MTTALTLMYPDRDITNPMSLYEQAFSENWKQGKETI